MSFKEELAAVQERVVAQIEANAEKLDAARDEKWPVDPTAAPEREIKPITLEELYEAVLEVRWKIDELYWRLF